MFKFKASPALLKATSHSAKLFAPFPRPNILPSKKPTWGPVPRRHLRLCLGPGSAEIKARPRRHPPQPRPDRARESLRGPAWGARGPGPSEAQGSQRGLPPTGWSLQPASLPPVRRLSLGVIKSEILLLVTPVLPARADLHMKGLRRAWAFSFSHSQ